MAPKKKEPKVILMPPACAINAYSLGLKKDKPRKCKKIKKGKLTLEK